MPGGSLRRLRRLAGLLDAGTPLIAKVGGPVMAVSLGMALYLEGAIAPEDCDSAACQALAAQVSLVTTDGTALLLVVLWLVFVLFVGRRARRLADVARRVADGDLSARVGVAAAGRPRDELLLVAGQFDRMLESLVTEQERLSALTAELEHQADHDPLTGLGNRRQLLGSLTRALDAGPADPLALVVLQLEQFNTVSDALGHDVGDLVLTTTALRLSGAVRGEELVARLDGDEFAVLVEGVSDPTDASALAARLLAAVSLPLEVEGATIVLSAQAGVVLHRPGDERTADDVVRDAVLALHEVQAADASPAALFVPRMREDVEERQRLATDLRAALADPAPGGLLLHYQPYARLSDPGEVAGFEALVRWRHPVRGMVSPVELVPVAEATGLIRPVGLWVLEQAASQAAAWRAALAGASSASSSASASFAMNVNLSPQQLLDADLVHRVGDVLARTALPPSALVLELTETAMSLDLDGAASRLSALRDLGVRIAIDDFGTGSSSLAYLHRLPVDVVKVDRAFVSRLETDPTALAMVRAVLDIASSLGLSTVAEGIETPGQLRILAELGCDKAQGYLLSAPVSSDAAGDLLAGTRLLGTVPARW